LCHPYAYLMSYCTVHILQFICHVAQPVSCSTTFMSRSVTRSTIFDHCVALGGVRSGVSSLRRTCCPLWSTWISLGFLSGSLRALQVCTYTHKPQKRFVVFVVSSMIPLFIYMALLVMQFQFTHQIINKSAVMGVSYLNFP